MVAGHTRGERAPNRTAGYPGLLPVLAERHRTRTAIFCYFSKLTDGSEGKWQFIWYRERESNPHILSDTRF